MTNLPPIETLGRPKSLRDLAADRLRTAIIDADFTFGELLSENTLAALLGISKTPIHEALMQLRTEGLVEILPQRGARVFQPTRELIADLCDFRVLLETRAMQLAYERNRAGLIVTLENIVEQMIVTWEARNVREYLRLDTEYHDQLYKLSGSAHLAAAYAAIAARVAAVRTQIVAPEPESRRTAFEEHKSIPKLLRQGGIDEVLKILTLHVDRLKDLFRDSESRPKESA
jgi:DNA-binding GntR family transcriptional regulator